MRKPCKDQEIQISMSLADELTPEQQKQLEDHLQQCRNCREYEQEERELDRKLIKLADSMNWIETRIEEEIRGKIHHKHERIPFVLNSVPMFLKKHRYAGLSLAASFLVLITITILVSTPGSLYAQVTKALKQASNLHIVGQGLHNGEWTTRGEIWYQKGRGYTIRFNQPGNQVTIIDDGKYQWKYRQGDLTALRTRNRNSHMLQEIEEVLNLQEFERILSTKPVGTQNIREHECAIYEWNNEIYRAVVYIDADNRVHRFEDYSRPKEGEWIKKEIQDFYYDVEIDPVIFEPDFGPDVEIVKAENQLDVLMNKVNLDRAVFRKEEFGHIFAVHETQRVESGIVYLLCSMRPTKETIDEFGEIRPSDQAGYGDFQLLSAWKRLDENDHERAYQPWDFAEVRYRGMSVMWYVLIQKGSWPKNAKECFLDVYFHTRGRLKDQYEEKGMPTYKRYKTFTTLPLPSTEISIANMLGEIYDEVKTIEPAVGLTQLRYGLEPNPDPGPNGEKLLTVLSSTPSRMPKAEFLDKGTELILRYKERK